MKEIRWPKLGETDAIIQLLRDTAQRVNSGDYSQKQIDLWLVKRPIEINRKDVDQGVWWVCVEDGDVLGVGTLATAEITGLFVHADHLREGIGRLLLSHMEDQILSRGETEARLDSTLTAERFYRRMGYHEVGRSRGGPPQMDVISMRKTLSKRKSPPRTNR